MGLARLVHDDFDTKSLHTSSSRFGKKAFFVLPDGRLLVAASAMVVEDDRITWQGSIWHESRITGLVSFLSSFSCFVWDRQAL